MFSLFRKKKPGRKSETDELVDELVASGEKHAYFVDITREAPYLKIQAASTEFKIQVVLALIHWLRRSKFAFLKRNSWWYTHKTLADLLQHQLPFKEDHILEILDYSIAQEHNFYREIPQMIRIVERYSKDHALSTEIKEKIETLAAAIEKKAHTSNEHRQVKKLRAVAGAETTALPIVPGEAWAQAALGDIQKANKEKQAAWGRLLEECQMASGSTPSGKWLKACQKHLGIIGPHEFKITILRWFSLADKPPEKPLARTHPWEPDPNQVFNPVNADLLKGLVWISSTNPDEEIARALVALAISSYRKLPGYGPRAAKVGNACIWALGNMPGMDGLAQLSILKIKLRQARAQALIDNALESAAKRNQMSPDEIAELCVPTYGLEEVGRRCDELGDYQSQLTVNDSEIDLAWVRSDGKHFAAIPKAVQDEFKEDLQEIKQSIKDLRKMLPAQRDRIENLYLAQPKWNFRTWRERYLDHPLVGTIARRLIWKFSLGDQAASGIWLDGQIVGRDNRSIDWLRDETIVELWHPIHVEPEVVVGWRQWLVEHEIRQPFKQAHREIYILTEAEVNTRVYSNRFAGHILKQHQFNALCQARGWKNALRLMVDAEVPPPTRQLPQWGLRAEFWVEACGDTYGTDTNDSGTYLYISTDQVRFYRLHELENTAHAGGGGYHPRTWNAPAAEPVILENIPPIGFSEIMRDVDLFVGVASVGNDPNWFDGGEAGRYVDYWHHYSFGNLSETAKTRKAVLETLLPRLKIAPRCRLTDKFLVVQGDIRTYKIHLGSANILMEPNDRYLCIVPARGGIAAGERIFLPFEGDAVLALILSKAFLLVEDNKITDPTIVGQIKSRR